MLIIITSQLKYHLSFQQIYNLFVAMIESLTSSTPNGLAPLDNTGLTIFIVTITCVSMGWGIFNLILLIRMPMVDPTERSERVNETNHKIIKGLIGMTKLTALVSFTATLIYFLIIMGGVERFTSFFYCIGFLLGSINSVLCSFISLSISSYVQPRLIEYSKFSLNDAYNTARRAANFQTFFCLSWTTLIMGLFLVLYQREHMEELKNPAQISKITATLVSFSFGSIIAAIGTRICNSIYSKGADGAVETLYLLQKRLPRDHRHPALICKAVGEVLNKSVSNVLDSIAYLAAVISIATYAAGENIVGTDQEGEIVFQLSLSNSYLPIMSFIFSLTYILLFSVIGVFVLRPNAGEDVRTNINFQKYAVIVFLIGFQSLVSYLCLPAEFYVKELGIYQRKPYHAYLCILFGMLICLLIEIGSELMTTHPRLMGAVSTSSSTGAATNIIYGLSFGYTFAFLPYIFIAATVFLCDYWLGNFGVGLAAVGFLSILPMNLHSSLVYSSLQNASYISYICKSEESTSQTLIDSAKTRKDFEPRAQTYLYGLLSYLGYAIALSYITLSEMTTDISLKSPTIFLGMILGAMYPFFFSACLLRSISKTYPAIAYDIGQQIDELPSMAQGSVEADFIRTNSLFSFQCIVSLKRFILVLFYPMIIIGIGAGPSTVLGFICGSVICGVQLGISSAISGSVWSTVKKQIGFGNVRDSQMNLVRPDSEWGKAAQVGNMVGLPLKDGVSMSVHMIVLYAGVMSLVLGDMYSRIHS